MRRFIHMFQRKRCSHTSQINDVEPSAQGCEDCLRTGDTWVHLRECLICGHVGCCDQSPNRHATKHFHATEHPIIRSLEPGEDWLWCYVDEVLASPGTARSTCKDPMGEGMSEANQELGRRHFEETEDFVEHAAAPFAQSAPGRGKGPQAMRASAEWLLTQFPDLHMTVEAVISNGDTMAVRIL